MNGPAQRLLFAARPSALRVATPALSSHAFSTWASVPMGPKDPILGLNDGYLADKDARKVNVGVGAYRDEGGKPVVLKSVRTAEQKIIESGANHEYLPITGLKEFSELACDMIYGKGCSRPKAKTQVLSGTGGLRVGGEFFKQFLPGAEVYIPNPTWGNHKAIFTKSGVGWKEYRYLDRKDQTLDFSGMCEDLKAIPNGSVVLLHACAHNPTGVDPNLEQWKELSSLLKAKNVVPFFDSAYQGFASGDADKDAAAVRQFVADGHPVMCTQSFSKNFGLYSGRVGCLSLVCQDEEEMARVESQLKLVIRPMYSNPPAWGARVVSTVLKDPVLNPQWYAECKAMADRIQSVRAILRSELEKGSSGRNWAHITDQIGMFAYTGLTADHCAKLVSDHHIYLTSDGRISMAGVNPENAIYIAGCINKVL